MAHLIFMIGAAASCEQPTPGKSRDERADDECNFQYRQCNSDYRFVSDGGCGRPNVFAN